MSAADDRDVDIKVVRDGDINLHIAIAAPSADAPQQPRGMSDVDSGGSYDPGDDDKMSIAFSSSSPALIKDSAITLPSDDSGGFENFVVGNCGDNERLTSGCVPPPPPPQQGVIDEIPLITIVA